MTSIQQGEYHFDFFNKDIQDQLDALKIGSDKLVTWVLDNDLLPNKLYDVVEIGCGRGNFIAAFKQRGYDVLGCDVSAGLVGLGKKYFSLTEKEVIESSALNFVQQNPIFKSDRETLILLFHVLEHLENPLEVIHALIEGRHSRTYIIELPLATSRNIFREHNFLATPMLKKYLEKTFSLNCIDMRVIPANGFIRFTLSEKPMRIETSFLINDNCLNSHLEMMEYLYTTTQEALLEQGKKENLFDVMVDKLRDTALQDIEFNINKGVELLNLAHSSRPNGVFIKDKLKVVNDISKIYSGNKT
jgi:SAM-dependent methyltransferase